MKGAALTRRERGREEKDGARHWMQSVDGCGDEERMERKMEKKAR